MSETTEQTAPKEPRHCYHCGHEITAVEERCAQWAERVLAELSHAAEAIVRADDYFVGKVFSAVVSLGRWREGSDRDTLRKYDGRMLEALNVLERGLGARVWDIGNGMTPRHRGQPQP